MQPNRDQWSEWEQSALRNLAAGVRAARLGAGLSQRALAEAAGIDRGQIANLESIANPEPKGEGESKSRLTELPRIGFLVRLAFVLRVPPVQLMYPDLPDGKVEAWPGIESSSIEALQWFSGDSPTSGMNPGPDPEIGTTERVRKSRELAGLRRAHRRARLDLLDARVTPDEARMTVEQAENLIESSRQRIGQLASEFRKQGWPVDE